MRLRWNQGVTCSLLFPFSGCLLGSNSLAISAQSANTEPKANACKIMLQGLANKSLQTRPKSLNAQIRSTTKQIALTGRTWNTGFKGSRSAHKQSLYAKNNALNLEIVCFSRLGIFAALRGVSLFLKGPDAVGCDAMLSRNLPCIERRVCVL